MKKEKRLHKMPEEKPENQENNKKLIPTEVSEEMKKSYLDYAMSVIVSRAIPAIEDGLKPVQRRILYSMYQMGLKPGTQTKKSARVVGDIMGKFHPHGDVAIYDALVRMAQDFSLRYPLIYGQGNFGCFTADTKIALADGRDLSFKDLIEEHKNGKRNFAFTIEDGEIKIAEIKNPRKTKESVPIMKVVLDNNEEIKCTTNHKFMLRDGSYKEARDLKSEDSLMPLHDKIECVIVQNYNHKVIKVEFLNESVDVYDLTIDKTHNFALAAGVFVHNSIDGDPPAAMRYSEARLMPLATELLEDIDKETVKFVPNYDNSLKEPELLPGKLPNLILNGATGIAVGMATNIPPHNLNEVCDAIIAYIKKPEITIEELCNYIIGPDFPTAGSVSGDMIDLYKTGRGRLVMRGKLTTETIKNKEAIIINEIPYMANKAELVSQIANLIQEKKIKDVWDLRDESSKGKIRVVIELRKEANSKFVINSLYKYTALQDSFNVNFLALVNGQPRILNLKQVVEEYVRHRKQIITNRSKFDLKKAEERLEIVDGLLIALKNIDEVVNLIKKSKNAIEALEGLVKKFSLTKKQAQAVLDTKLQQLTSLEVEKLKKEQEELKKTIQELQKILADINEILKIIIKEVSDIKKKYGDNRRTNVLQNIKEIAEKDLIQEKEIVVTITDKGYSKRMDVKSYKEQKRGGKGMVGTGLATGDFVKQLITCSTRDYLMFFTSKGRVYWLKAYDIPAAERYSKGKAIVNMINLKDETITNVISVKTFENDLFMATKKGIVKKISLKHFSKPRGSGVRAINMPNDNSDTLIGVEVVRKGQEILLSTKKGQAIRFNESDVREMGRASYGVKGIELHSGDEVVSMDVLQTKAILTITKNGYGKRTAVEDYRKTARAGKGVINLKVSEKTGDIVTTVSVNDNDGIIITTRKGIVIRTSLENIRVMGRAAQGVRIVKLQQDDFVTDLVKIVETEENSTEA